MIDIPDAIAQAKTHHRAGRLRDAETTYRQVLQAEPDNAEARYLLGALCASLGMFQEAVENLRQATRLNPYNAEAYNHLGVTLAQLKMGDQAAASFQAALRIKPDFSDARSNLKKLLARSVAEGWALAAAPAPRHAPGSAAHFNALGIALAREAKRDEAEAAFRRALQIQPDDARAHNNLANVLEENGRLDEAIASYREALRLSPDFAEALDGLGDALRSRGDLQESAQCCRRAVQLKPDVADAHLNLALTLLCAGDLEQGWKEYEWRWRASGFPSPPRDYPQPRWDGGELRGKIILLYSEQGMGDMIQFARYAPLVAGRGGRVILECPAPLQSLLGGVAGVERVSIVGQPSPRFDTHCPLMSLPFILETNSLAAIPAQVPYLRPPAEAVEHWRRRLQQDKTGLKVGLAWAGSTRNKRDPYRSIKFEALAPLGDVPGVSFYSLQFGEGAAQAAKAPPGMKLIDHTPELKNFQDAALVANLDLVITVDTATAHLAGALGKPVWTLLPFAPDWRWMADREDSPWYPTMRLFRQTSIGDWASVVQAVTARLRAAVISGEFAEAPRSG